MRLKILANLASLACVIGMLLVAGAKAQDTQPAAKVDPRARELLEQLGQAYGQLKSLELKGTITLVVEDQSGKQTREARFATVFCAPNQFRQQVPDQPLLGCTGKKIYAFSKESNAFVQADVSADRLVFKDLPNDIGAMLTQQNPSLCLALAKKPVEELTESIAEVKSAGNQPIDGKPYPALVMTPREGNAQSTLLLDPQSHLLRRVTTDLTPLFHESGRPEVKSATLTVDYAQISPNAPVPPDAFAWSAPDGAKDLVAARAQAQAHIASILEDNPAMALVGKPAPDFSLEDLEGKTVKLSELKGSVVVLDFFATWCGPCVQGLPATQQLYQDLGKSGLKVFAVNQKEPRDKVAAFVAEKKLTLPVLLDSEGQVGARYMVSGIPQLVVIGRDGKVKKVEVGYDPTAEAKLREFIQGLLK